MELLCDIKFLSAATGQSAVEKYNYQMRLGTHGNHPDPVVWSYEHALPSWASDFRHFIKELDNHFNRARGRLIYYGYVAIPNAIADHDKVDLGVAIVKNVAEMCAAERQRGEAVTAFAVMHLGQVPGGNPQGNTHLHFIFSTQINDGLQRTPAQWFMRPDKRRPALSGAPRSREMGTYRWLLRMRQVFAETMNLHIGQHAPHLGRVEYLSYEQRKVFKLPQLKLGPVHTKILRGNKTPGTREKFSWRGFVNQLIEQHFNPHLAKLSAEKEAMEEELENEARSMAERARRITLLKEAACERLRLHHMNVLEVEALPEGVLVVHGRRPTLGHYPSDDIAQGQARLLKTLVPGWMPLAVDKRLWLIEPATGMKLLLCPDGIALDGLERVSSSLSSTKVRVTLIGKIARKLTTMAGTKVPLALRAPATVPHETLMHWLRPWLPELALPEGPRDRSGIKSASRVPRHERYR